MARRKMTSKAAPKGSQPQTDPSGASAAKSTSTIPVISTGSAQTEERRKERKQEQRRQQLLIGGGVIGIIALLAAIAIIVNTLPQEAPIVAEATTRYATIEQGFNTQGYPRLGNADSPIQVKVYSSFSCPACDVFHSDVMPRMIERVQAGEMSFIFVPMATYGDAGGVEAARSAMCVANQGQFWGFHDTLFEWQNLFGRQAFPPNRLRRGVEAFGLDLAEYDSCLGSAAITTLLNSAENEGEAIDGFGGTPAVTVNGILVAGSALEAVNLAINNAITQFRAAPTQPESQPDTQTTPTTPTTPPQSPTEAVTTPEISTTEEPVTIITEEAAATAEPTP